MINPNEISGLLQATTNIQWLHHTYRQCALRLKELGCQVQVTELFNPKLPAEQILRTHVNHSPYPESEPEPHFGLDVGLGAVEFTKPESELPKLAEFIPPVVNEHEIIDKTKLITVALIQEKSYEVYALQVDGIIVGYQCGVYQVRAHQGRFVCSCSDFKYRTHMTAQGCKHIQALKPLLPTISELPNVTTPNQAPAEKETSLVPQENSLNA